MEEFEKYLNQIGEVGFVTEVVGSIAFANGLPNASPNELLIFETGEIGRIFSLKNDLVEILTFSKKPIRVGLRVARTGKSLEIPTGNELLANVIDPFGNSFEHHKLFKKPEEFRSLDNPPPGIKARKTITKHFETGVSIVDLMIPLGRGQRELIIGDRKTGKSSFLLQTLVYAAKQGDIGIYAAIGKNKLDIKRTEEYFREQGVLDKIIIVASASQDPPGVIFLTPYSAMTIAEYFKDQGKNTLVVLDDLTTHAKFYREISLIGKRFPGRDSYPGDTFYVHASLLERAGNFHYPFSDTQTSSTTSDNSESEVSITCMPAAETLQGDLSGYIPTNIMSMTDGHIYFDSDLFSQGRRPSINPFLSVTRVGRQTQPDSKRSISRELLSFLTLFDKMQNIVHFGSELTESARVVIETGNKILQLFDQETNTVVPANVQPIVLSFLWGDDSRKTEISKLAYYREKITELYQKDSEYKEMVDDIVLKSNSFNEILWRVKEKITSFMIGNPDVVPIATTTATPPAEAQAQENPSTPNNKTEVKSEK